MAETYEQIERRAHRYMIETHKLTAELATAKVERDAQAEQIKRLREALENADGMLTALLFIHTEPEPGSIGAKTKAVLREVDK